MKEQLRRKLPSKKLYSSSHHQNKFYNPYVHEEIEKRESSFFLKDDTSIPMYLAWDDASKEVKFTNSFLSREDYFFRDTKWPINPRGLSQAQLLEYRLPAKKNYNYRTFLRETRRRKLIPPSRGNWFWPGQ